MNNIIPGIAVLALFTVQVSLAAATAFEGRIAITLTRGGEAQHLLYTAGTNCLRIARQETDRPYAVNLVARDSGAVTLLFPHNRSFMRLKNAAVTPAPPNSLPPQPDGGGAPATMPAMPVMPMESAELTATTDTTNLLGCACTRYELKQRGEVMEIWATDQLPPFPPYQENPPHRFGPRMIEEQWGGLVQARKLFPLLAVLKFENGPERLRFEVKAVTPEKIKPEDAEQLFQPPADYQELQPPPF